MNTDYLKEFEEMNHTTESVFDLGETGLLAILKDGTNLTRWDKVRNPDDVLYLSIDFSYRKNYTLFNHVKHAKVMVIQNYVCPPQDLSTLFDKEISLIFHLSDFDSLVSFYAINWDTSRLDRLTNVFVNNFSLEYVYLDNWDTSNVDIFWGMFSGCCSLKAIDGIENWDLSSAENMESMFESCFSLEDISFLSNWDMSNVENIFEMFKDCYSLKDASCLNWEFERLKDGDNLFVNCENLEKFPSWYDEEFINQFGIRKYLNIIEDDSFLYNIASGFEPQDFFIAIEYIKDEKYLLKLLRDSSTHYYARRAALLNVNLKDSEILEEYADSADYVERANAIENPNFKNIGILRRLARDDESYIVRFKAQQKLNELKEKGYEIIDDYAGEFKKSFENQDIDRAYEVLSHWGGYDSADTNYIMAKVILDSFNEKIEFTETFDLYLESFMQKPKDPSLLDWFNSTAIESMEKRVDDDIGFSQMFNNRYKSNKYSNDYAKEFLRIFEDILENGHVESLALLQGIIISWEENFPDDANMHCAYVILNIMNLSEEDLEDRIEKAKELDPIDKNSYPKLLTLMNAVCEANKIL